MAKLILTDADQTNKIPLASGLTWEVTGTNGVDDVIVAAGAVADLNLLGGEDKVVFAGNASDYTVSVSGTTVSFIYDGGNTVTVPASTVANTITFADGETASLVIDTGAGTVNLGTQVISDTAAAVSGTTSGPAPDLGPFEQPTTNPAFSVVAVDAAEGETASFTITLNQAQATSTTVDYAVGLEGGATAADHGDITVDGTVDNTGTGTITFAPGEVTKTITVAVAQDEESPEDGEGISVTLSNPAGADNIEVETATATADITDVPVTFTLTASATSVMEGEQITYTLTASQNLSEDAVVSFSVVPDDTGAANQGTNSTNLNDFASGSFNPADKTIVAGTSAVNYTVTAQSDGITELPESYTVKAVIDGVEYTVDTTLLDAPVTEYTLTTGIDDINGTELDETIVATSTTFTALDDIDGADGEDTMILTDTDGGNFSLITSATVKNVENLNVQHVIDTTGSLTLDVSSGWTGLDTVSATQSGANPGAISVTTKSNATTVNTKGGTTVSITDSGTTDTLTTASASGNTGAVTVTSDKLTSLSLSSSNQSATVTAAAGTRELGVTLDTMTGGTVTDAEATSVAVTASGGASTGVTLTAVKATSVSINADEKLTLADVNLTAATTITATGDSLVTISATSDVTALTKIDASGTTGGVAVTPALGNSVAFIGGAGNDSATFAASTGATNMGAGDDTVVLTGSALGAGGSVDAGDGTDTLSMTAANAATASGATTFETTISNFEALTISDAANANNIDVANLDGISNVTYAAGTVTAGSTLTNLAATNQLTIGALLGAGANLTASLADSTGSTDIVNVKLAADDGFVSVGSLVLASVETINIDTMDTNTTSAATTPFTQPLSSTSVVALDVDGAIGVNLGTLTGATALTTFDASGVTGATTVGAVTLTTAALTNVATLTGGTGNDTLNAAAATKAVTLTGNAGDDTLTGSSTVGSTIDGGAGNDTLTGGAGNDTITGGAGNDTITPAAGIDTLTGGDGTDTFDFNTVATNGNSYSTITDFATGDKLDFVGISTGTIADVTDIGAGVTLAGTAVFQDYIDTAAAGTGGTNALVKWFQFQNDTYVVVDNSDATTYQNGTDHVVKLSGQIDLSTADLASEVLTV